jgi:outer membrane protein assembly factor BamB
MSDTSSLTPGPLPGESREPRTDAVRKEQTELTGSRPLAGPALSDPDAEPISAELAMRPRMWPGIVLIILQWLVIKVPGWIEPATMMQFFAMFFGPMVFGALLVLWWLFASRQPWRFRLLGLLSLTLTGLVAIPFAHPSTYMGMIMFGIPLVTTAWVGWMVLTRRLIPAVQQAGLFVVLAVCWLYFDLQRFDGVDGSMNAEMNWRWAPTAEERYLAEREGQETTSTVAAAGAAPLVLQPGDWPAFRGEARDGKLTGVRIASNWKEQPPKQLWKHRIGPGWGSFSVIGNRLFTQEQRGKSEVVLCCDTETGKEVWAHVDDARFTEIVAGPGPRATPTFHDGKLYSLGASGKLNCLDAGTGKVHWTRDIAEDSGAKIPQWGFASSPLIVHGMVIVYAGGEDGKAVLGYKAETGVPAWLAGDLGHGYCSPQLATLAGVEQVLAVGEAGLAGFDPVRGEQLWFHDWAPQKGAARVVQPTVVSPTDVLIGTGFGIGTRRVRIGRQGKAWTDEEQWTTQKIKPYYNDVVLHAGHVYGFDSNIFTCVAVEDGAGKWRARGYGNGQVLLLADQGLLLILSETGEVALLKANPQKHEVLGKFKAIEGKTWNHPVVAHGKLFVRNGEEIACYQLKPSD